MYERIWTCGNFRSNSSTRANSNHSRDVELNNRRHGTILIMVRRILNLSRPPHQSPKVMVQRIFKHIPISPLPSRPQVQRVVIPTCHPSCGKMGNFPSYFWQIDGCFWDTQLLIGHIYGRLFYKLGSEVGLFRDLLNPCVFFSHLFLTYRAVYYRASGGYKDQT